MWLKPAIAIVFFLLLFSLVSALFYLFKDRGTGRRRTLHSLGVRVTLAAVLLGLIGYGATTGQLKSSAPWSANNRAMQEQIKQQALKDIDKQK